jgi:hypothetical protein
VVGHDGEFVALIVGVEDIDRSNSREKVPNNSKERCHSFNVEGRHTSRGRNRL